jgi:hypothetical protein
VAEPLPPRVVSVLVFLFIQDSGKPGLLFGAQCHPMMVEFLPGNANGARR